MQDISWEAYEELMMKVYPSSFKRAQKGQTTPEVWADTPKSWEKLSSYTQSEIISSLQEQLKNGKRRFKDTASGTYKI